MPGPIVCNSLFINPCCWGPFFVLTPRVLVALPPKGKIYTIALVHALIFAIIYYILHNFFCDTHAVKKQEGFFQATPTGGLGYDCDLPSDCKSNTCKNNVCAVIPGTTGSKCGIKACSPGFACINGMCEIIGNDGSRCTSNVLCKSEYCLKPDGAVSGVCTINPNPKPLPTPDPVFPPTAQVNAPVQPVQVYAPPPPVQVYVSPPSQQYVDPLAAAPAQVAKAKIPFFDKCSSSDQCVTGFCHPTSLQCHLPPPGKGEDLSSCTTWGDCKSRYCLINPATGSGVCRFTGTEGTECRKVPGYSDGCGMGLACTDGFCKVQPRPTGAPCRADVLQAMTGATRFCTSGYCNNGQCS